MFTDGRTDRQTDRQTTAVTVIAHFALSAIKGLKLSRPLIVKLSSLKYSQYHQDVSQSISPPCTPKRNTNATPKIWNLRF